MTKTERVAALIIAYLIGMLIVQHMTLTRISNARLEESEMCRVVSSECNLLK